MQQEPHLTVIPERPTSPAWQSTSAWQRRSCPKLHREPRDKQRGAPTKEAPELNGWLILEQTDETDPLDVTTCDASNLRLCRVCKSDLGYFPNMTSLDLSENKLEMTPFGCLPALQTLSMRMCEMDSLVIGPEMVDGHIQFGALSKLDLSCNQLETGQLRALGRLRNLTYLDLSHNQLPEVPSMEIFDKLQVLKLANNRLTNDALPHLVAASRLDLLDLSDNRIQGLVSGICFPMLQTLHLNNNALSNSSAEQMLSRLSALAPLLQTLEMWGNSLDDSQLPACPQMPHCRISCNAPTAPCVPPHHSSCSPWQQKLSQANQMQHHWGRTRTAQSRLRPTTIRSARPQLWMTHAPRDAQKLLQLPPASVPTISRGQSSGCKTARLCRTLLQANNRRPTTVPTPPKGTLATLSRGSLTGSLTARSSSNTATKHRQAVQQRSPRRIQMDSQCTKTREIHTELSAQQGMEEGLRSAIPIRHPAFSARPALRAKKGKSIKSVLLTRTQNDGDANPPQNSPTHRLQRWCP